MLLTFKNEKESRTCYKVSMVWQARLENETKDLNIIFEKKNSINIVFFWFVNSDRLPSSHDNYMMKTNETVTA